ncbi:two-component sensor histidine kinase [Herminiimonas sp. KBW02]|uniref:heavy metal sensor histidine kinase n=1 Tax=Herminiimonas sp. KBW02 TaxID=2153363 RepID=UPI000F597ACB|nr:heavy metal sensor histidine kinase [Herminiimonas sp. KBW02]RQO33502.1 two-component sensor histidine kinase [Herminiimonas sp. KBW02]
MKLIQHMSLTSRIGLLFFLVAILTFSAVGTYLYRSLFSQLEYRDDQELIGKITLMRHLAEESASIAAIRANPHYFLDAAASHDRLIVMLKEVDGKLILHTNPDQGSLPVISVLPADMTADQRAITLLWTSSGLAARAIASKGKLNSGEQILIVVARTASDRMELLKAYRIEVWIAALVGTLLVAFSGYLLVRRGLRPLRLIAAQARSITAHRLDKRLDIASTPQELHDMVQAFNAMLDRLDSSFQRLSQFSADLAHDLRTPINNLMVQTQVALVQARSVEDYQALLISNVEEYERLARMVESMLFLARAEHTHVVMNKSPVSLPEELQRIADYFEGLAEETGVRIVVHAQGKVYADAILLRRALGNLVANAIRYTPAGEVISLHGETRIDGATIRIVNPGPGIASEHIPHLFERFYRADAARTNTASSAGLGLAIVQSIMVLHGGKVAVRSAKDGLTVFSLIFPAK